MTRKSAFRVLVAICLPAAISAQPVPIRQLSATTKSAQTFRTWFGLSATELPDGRVLVKDNTGKRLMVFDALLASATDIANADGINGSFYPTSGFSSPLLPYLGDTTLLVDRSLPGFLAITPAGRIGSTISHPVAKDLSVTIERDGESVGFDNVGRFIYRAFVRVVPKAGDPPSTATRDTIPIVRADLDRRKVDTIGSYGVAKQLGMVWSEDPTGKRTVSQIINPFPAGPDGWAVLSTGTLGVVRGHDYHVDWLTSDGKKSSTGKMPFDWKPFTEKDKLARIDSMKHVVDSMNATGKSRLGVAMFNRRAPDGRVIGVDTVRATISYVPLDQMPDYVPPIRENAVKADRDGNMWILPTTSAQAQGGLLYDIVNEKAGLFQRVQLPKNCVIVGFGKKGVVYVASMVEGGWALERRKIQ